MHKLIASLTMLSALSASAYAETPQFPDPSVLPPDDTNTSSDGVTTTQQQTYSYTQPAGSHTTTTTPTGMGITGTYVYPQNGGTTTAVTGNTTGNSAAGIYVYPQADITATTSGTAVSPTTTYRYPTTPAATTYYTQPYTTGSQQQHYYNPTQYFAPGSMIPPPTPSPMVMPSFPTFNWPNIGYGYRSSNYLTGSPANTQATTQTTTTQNTNTQQIDALNKSLSSLRQQQTDLESKAQETLSLQEKTIAELRKQLEDASKGKGDLESQLNALKGELAESVKKAELESCKAEKGEIESEKQRFAKEKQQLVNALENETKDSDADGIPDKFDKCPDSAAGVSVDAAGCEPPKDSDSVPDDADKCLDTKEGVKVADNGCDAIPDADQDGIADAEDLCPKTAANTEVNQVGCSKTENINLKGVNFETGSAVLTANSLPILDEAAITLNKHPELNIEVGGHTDSSGDTLANEKLSQSRAEAVMKYLVEKGIKAELLSAKGYGPNTPLADNATPDGKAQNRRVELKILEQQ